MKDALLLSLEGEFTRLKQFLELDPQNSRIAKSVASVQKRIQARQTSLAKTADRRRLRNIKLQARETARKEAAAAKDLAREAAVQQARAERLALIASFYPKQ